MKRRLLPASEARGGGREAFARRAKLGVLALLWSSAAVGWSADEKFDFETVRARAKALAGQPYVRPSETHVPGWLRKLNYDEHRIIEFNAERSLWRGEKLPYQVQFFHLGYIFWEPVQISEVRDARARPLAFQRELFNYRSLKVGELPETLGFAGFKFLADLNRPNDELGAFLGASYFRLLCQKAHYGLSARGLALNTAEVPGPEEFPRFTEFWLVRPEAGAKSVTFYALLDSESVAGAYRFEITPGAETVARIKAAIYARKNVKVFGVAPLTSMFWRGENASARGDDFRQEVHDSDGLLLHTGSDEWIWRPLRNPKAMGVVTFEDKNPRGFGLLQRDRTFDHYNDLEAHYHLRPSAWVEPIGEWGPGAVRLAELPTKDEYLDNIVAFWTPAKLPPPGEPIEFEYRLHWYLERAAGPAGTVTATHHHRSGEVERFLVDFSGAELARRGEDAAPEPVVSVGDGAKLEHASVQKNPYDGSWRVTFTVKPDGSGRAMDLRCFLRAPPHVLTETWSYLWQP